MNTKYQMISLFMNTLYIHLKIMYWIIADKWQKSVTSLMLILNKYGLWKTMKDMFCCENWDILNEAILAVTLKRPEEDGIQASIYYLLMKAAQILEGEALSKREPNWKDKQPIWSTLGQKMGNSNIIKLTINGNYKD